MRKCIILFPFYDKNAYIQNTRRMLSKYYEVISWEQLRKNPFLFFRLKGIHLNWIENTITLLQKIQLIFMRLFKKKVVWIFHNSMPHECRNRRKAKNNFAFMARVSSQIIIHSKESRALAERLLLPGQNTSITYLKHVNYIGCYRTRKENTLRDRLGIDQSCFLFLFTGSICPYKNIEFMIHAFREAALPNAVLLIAGRANDQAYADKISAMIEGDSFIMFKDGYIPDNQLSDYLNAANVMVLPHSRKSVLNSGMMIMAFSYALPVITADIAMAKDFTSDVLWQYTYSSRKEKLLNLKKAMISAYSAGIDQNHQMGLTAQKLMKSDYNAQIIAEKLKSIYES